MIRNIIFILFLPVFVYSQQLAIKRLPDNINTNNAEINFVQINDSTAYFTVVSEIEGNIESNIYTSTFKHGDWSKKKYTKYNSDIFNTGNISFSEEGRTFFNICNNEMEDCKIVYLSSNTKEGFYEISALFSEEVFNTQAFTIRHGIQTVMYFVSDRKGGFGGLDIWLSIIDSNGNFGIPINAGDKINSSADEITPFYNKHDGMMYFSSNKISGSGGFDVYKAKGKLNLWKEAINWQYLNTENDELYLTFYDKNNGYFSSNRKGAKLSSSEYCCNDIFSFSYLKSTSDTIKTISEIQNYFPLSLYFHNDEPDPGTLNSVTKKTYKEAYISYFMMKSNYIKQNSNLNNFFEEILQKNFNTLNRALNSMFFELSRGADIEIQIRGYTSPLHTPEYNQNLSQRRISSLINYLMQFRNGLLAEYIYSKKLIISQLPFGESVSSEKVSDDANNKKKSVYSTEAMMERKINIVNIILQE